MLMGNIADIVADDKNQMTAIVVIVPIPTAQERAGKSLTGEGSCSAHRLQNTRGIDPQTGEVALTNTLKKNIFKTSTVLGTANEEPLTPRPVVEDTNLR